jgi:hypothetical protein
MRKHVNNKYTLPSSNPHQDTNDPGDQTVEIHKDATIKPADDESSVQNQDDESTSR